MVVGNRRVSIPLGFGDLLTAPLLYYFGARVPNSSSPYPSWDYRTDHDLPIPNNAGLIGGTIYAQWYGKRDMTINNCGFCGGVTEWVSGGAAITIGR